MQILRFAQNDRLLRERSEESRLILALTIWRDALRDCPSPSCYNNVKWRPRNGHRQSSIVHQSPIEPRSTLA